MSFSSDVKRELCNIPLGEKEHQYAECYGMLLFARKFSSREIVLKTENLYVARRFEHLLLNLFNPIIEKISTLKFKNTDTMLHKVTVVLKEDCHRIYEDFGHTLKDVNLRINRANLENDYLYPYFFRGAFLSCGSVSDPQKGFHLELTVKYKALSENFLLLLNEIDLFTTSAKITSRSGSYVIYFKGNDRICDFLGYIGAGNSVMYMMEASAYKELRNKANRKRNSEIANLQKLATASAIQSNAIQKIMDTKGLSSLPDELKEIAILRYDNPDMSLKELGENLQKPISRSGVNHRLQRIMKIAEAIKE